MLTQAKFNKLEFNNSISNNCRKDDDWFTCVSNKCLCGNQGSHAVVCDTHRQTSAVLDCHCVTYDKKIKQPLLSYVSTTVRIITQ